MLKMENIPVQNAGVLTINRNSRKWKNNYCLSISKHDIQDIEREQFDVIAKQSITVNTDDYSLTIN